MAGNFRIPGKVGKGILWVVVLLFCIGMAERKFFNQRFDDLVVKVDTESGLNFLTESEVRKIATDNGSDPVQGAKLSSVDLSILEKRVRKNKLVEKCSAYRDLNGRVILEVEQSKPVARWIGSSENEEWSNAEGFYINRHGEYMPLSVNFTAKVLLVTGGYFQSRKNIATEKDKQLLELFSFLNSDGFWNAQVTEMEVGKDGQIRMWTALGNSELEFGNAENFESKFNKLKVFYKSVLKEDWNRYSRVSIKFKDQIVCE